MASLKARLDKLRTQIKDNSPRPTLLFVTVFAKAGVEIEGEAMTVGVPIDRAIGLAAKDFPPLAELIPAGPDHARLLKLATSCPRRINMGGSANTPGRRPQP